MIRVVFSLMILIFSSGLIAQDDWDNLVSWTAEYDKIQSTINIKAKMKPDWVIYSQHTDPEGPIPLEFSFEDTAGVELVGAVKELTVPVVKMSDMFGVEVMKFSDEALFSQKIKTDLENGVIKGNVTFMTCDSQRCLPPKTVPFEVKI